MFSKAPYILLLLFALGATAQRKVSTQNRRLRAEAPTVTADSAMHWAVADSAISFKGYQKTARATRESVFVTNHLPVGIHGLKFTIGYFDLENRQLHSRQCQETLEIPSGQTRRLDFPSWDPQHTFYFYRSPRPRTPAVPYTVKILADSVLLSPQP